MEFALVNNQGSSAGAAATARSSAGVESWLTKPAGAATVGNSTSVAATTTGTTPGFASSVVPVPTDATLPGTLVIANLRAVIQSCWVAGGSPGIVMCNAKDKVTISGFVGIATLYREAGTTSKGTAIVGAADLFISDFGEHRIVPNRFQRAATATAGSVVLVLDMDYWKVAYLTKVKQKEVGRTGAAERRLIDVNYCLVAASPTSSGKISDII